MQFNIWFIVWLLVSIGLLSFSVWTFIILMRQKKSWREFAKKYGLRYKNSALMSSPQVSGVYRDYSVWMFTGEHESERGGANRKLTAIEIELDSRMPISGAIASGGMIGIVQELKYGEELVPTYDCWSGDYIIRCDDKYIVNEYLTKERAEALSSIMETKSYWMIFIFKGNDTILRIDTPEPFESLEKLTKTLDKMIDVAQVLELKKGESGRLKGKSVQRRETARVEIEESDIAVMGLELEDDEPAKEAKEPELAVEDDEGSAETSEAKDDDQEDEPAADKAKGKKKGQK